MRDAARSHDRSYAPVGIVGSDVRDVGQQVRGVCIIESLDRLDEALADLDAIVQGQLLDLLEDLKERLSIACLYVSHDLSSVFRLCGRVLVLHQGRFVDELTPLDCARPERHEAFTRLMDAAAVVHF